MASETNGGAREFQDDHKYFLPKDSPEHDRLDAQSAGLVALMSHSPYQAPLTNPKKIIDIGCGTGTMTHLLAQRFPTAEVIGIDLAPVPETRHGKLPNLSYVQGDIRDLIGKDSRFGPGCFDYVFERLLIFGMTEWENHIASISQLLRPGGWLEMQEFSVELWSGRNERLGDTMEWYQKLRQDAGAVGLDVEIGARLRQLFEAQVGLEKVREAVFPLFTKWPPERDEMREIVAQLPSVLATVSRKVCEGRRSEEEVQEIERGARAGWEKGAEEGGHFDFHVVVAQKK